MIVWACCTLRVFPPLRIASSCLLGPDIEVVHSQMAPVRDTGAELVL